jgi:DNA-binding transcriptional regulator LsrR (DeoR family)
MSRSHQGLALHSRALAPVSEMGTSDEDVVFRVAEEFLREFERTKAPRLKDVAKLAGCSRNAVKDHVRSAVAKEILSVTLKLPKREELSRKLAQKFQLAEAVVTQSTANWQDQKAIRSILAPEIPRYLERFATMAEREWGKRTPLRIGVDGGETLYQAVWDARPKLPKLKYELVPLVFGPVRFTAAIVANILAQKLQSADAKVLVRDEFKVKWAQHSSSKGLHFSIEMPDKKIASNLHLTLVGIGSTNAGRYQKEMPRTPRPARGKRQHFGDILNLPFDRTGRAHPTTPIRPVLLSLEDLKALSQRSLVVGAAGGRDKLEAIHTVLRCGYISVLITDPSTAEQLMEMKA